MFAPAQARLSVRISVLALALGATACGSARGQVPAFAGPSAPSSATPQIAVLAGGCFWGVDAVFKHVRGITSVVSGYSGGGAATAEYEVVSTGTTGHAKSVQITFDPSQVSYATLLRIFFSVALDPTELNRQGPDVGTQYRSVIFYTNDDQRQIATAYFDQLGRAKGFGQDVASPPRGVRTQTSCRKPSWGVLVGCGSDTLCYLLIAVWNSAMTLAGSSASSCCIWARPSS